MRGLQIGDVLLAVVIASLFLVGCKLGESGPDDMTGGMVHSPMMVLNRTLHSLDNVPLHVPPGDWVVLTADNYEAYKQYVKGHRAIIASADERIQKAINLAEAGDTILVPPASTKRTSSLIKGSN